MRAFVETTILANILLKTGPECASAKKALATFERSTLHSYALKELRAGPLSGYVWLHNKLVTTRSLPETMLALNRLVRSPMTSLPATALEAWAEGLKASERERLGELREKYGDAADAHSVELDRVRLTVKSLVLRAWRRRKKITDEVVGELSCFGDPAPREGRGGQVDMGRLGCRADECAMARELKSRNEDLFKLWGATCRQPERGETMRRARALRKLWRTPQRKFEVRDCRSLGDAVFALFAPSESVILTTNLRDLEPLAASVGRHAKTPDQVLAGSGS